MDLSIKEIHYLVKHLAPEREVLSVHIVQFKKKTPIKITKLRQFGIHV